ncbi:MAG TPA: prenyltransferase/squalene oxidase repeat-containing protein, partial [Planctomycetota bacterium]|nr:prenyltransferase/squalene oxidase repeat-containing protein [Planctomycetota bacterium]
LQESLERAVRLIERSQGETGGWYYEPERSLEHEGSVTVCLVQALRAARNAGIAVNKKVIDDALDYLRRSQKSDGSFRYQLGDERSTPALTAAGVATLQAMGEYSSEAVESGIGNLLRATEGTSLAGFTGASPFPQYQRFYTAQAFYHYRDPKVFEAWFRVEREKLLRTQRDDGTWAENSTLGIAYTTATNVLVLEIPLGLLPIFQR